ncbi:MAG: Gldg family protein [Gammaproteobacteria bacterium]|nr:Gldg family protein [Gammaproteobacteria bacterium]
MKRYALFGFVLLAGVALLLVCIAMALITLQGSTLLLGLALVAGLLVLAGVLGLRADLALLLRRRRIEIAAFTLGALCVIGALGHLVGRTGIRIDMTEAGLHSLAEQTLAILERLDKPVHVVFFHDQLMLETVELYERMAARSELLTVEFHDPTLNPAQARLLGVRFAGTAVLSSEDRRLQEHGGTEEDIVNAIVRVTRASRQSVCFLDGHNEADPFSMESHDHTESSGGADHSHGLGATYVLHDRHGLAKARSALETLSYVARLVNLTRGGDELDGCTVLVVAGPKVALLADEVQQLSDWLAAGGNALFMLDPFVRTGLEPLLLEYGVVLDESIVIDPASHYWTDVSAPAVTRYNNHQVTRDLPLTFFPGARSLSPTAQRIPGTNVTPVVNSSPTSYAESNPDRASFEPGQDRKGPLTLMVLASRRPLEERDATAIQLGGATEQSSAAPVAPVNDANRRVTGSSRIAVIGDSDFASNSFFHFLGNGNLFLNAVNYLAAQERLIGIEPRIRELPQLSITNRQLKGTFLLSMLLVPGVLSVIGVAVWWGQR